MTRLTIQNRDEIRLIRKMIVNLLRTDAPMQEKMTGIELFRKTEKSFKSKL